MNKSPAFQWYPKDILSSARVQMMTLAEECAYRRLLDYCWINGSVPADAAKAARLVGKGCTVEVVRIALEMFEADPLDENKLVHDRLEVEREKQQSNSRVRQAAAEARWNKQGTSADARGKQVKSKSDANAMQTDMQNDALHTSSSSSTTFSKEKGGGGTRASGVGNGKPPTAAESPPVERETKAKEARLDKLQSDYPQHDVRKVREKYLRWCRENQKDAKWEIFEEKWLKTEFEPMDNDDLIEPASPENRRNAIEECLLCDANGYLKNGDGVRICKHGKNGGKT